MKKADSTRASKLTFVIQTPIDSRITVQALGLSEPHNSQARFVKAFSMHAQRAQPTAHTCTWVEVDIHSVTGVVSQLSAFACA